MLEKFCQSYLLYFLMCSHMFQLLIKKNSRSSTSSFIPLLVCLNNVSLRGEKNRSHLDGVLESWAANSRFESNT